MIYMDNEENQNFEMVLTETYMHTPTEEPNDDYTKT